jgi:hypothetical protein
MNDMNTSTRQPVNDLNLSGLYGRYLGGTGQGVEININNLRENLSINNVVGLKDRINGLGLLDGIHNISLRDLPAVFTSE